MKKTAKFANACKLIIFTVLVILLMGVAGFYYRPIWRDWNNFDTTYGFYEEPENTIETIFLGASIVANGIIPMELYENYGICAYNLGTEQQPMLMSFYWLEEAYRLHPQTLSTVVLDVSMFRRVPERGFYQKAWEAMPLSEVKLRAIYDCTNDLNETIYYSFPLLTYHSRWRYIARDDYRKFGYEINSGSKGYHFVFERLADKTELKDIAVPEYDSTVDYVSDFNDEALEYLDRMVEFCREKDLKLVLMKSPVLTSWLKADSKAAQQLADQYGLEYYDFNYSPYIDEIGYVHATDSDDGTHMNYYGASKLTDWFGKYLVVKCDATNVKGNEIYQYLETSLDDYRTYVAPKALNEKKTPLEYIKTFASDSRYVTFLLANDVSVETMKSEGLYELEQYGFSGISKVCDGDCYVAAVCASKALAEELDLNEVIGEGTLPDGENYTLSAEGEYYSAKMSCVIADIEYSDISRGLNLITYDLQNHEVIDVADFDPDILVRTDLTDSVDVDNYIQMCDRTKKVVALNKDLTQNDFLKYLKEFWSEDCTIFLSVKDEASNSLDEEAREAFRKMGLVRLSELGLLDSYAAVIQKGKVQQEVSGHDVEPVEIKGIGYLVISGGWDSGNVSSVLIDETEYSKSWRGINVVVYDNIANRVLDSVYFDTYENAVTVD